jgi:hypothetical protein
MLKIHQREFQTIVSINLPKEFKQDFRFNFEVKEHALKLQQRLMKELRK